MKYFVAYRFTGEGSRELSAVLGGVCEALRSAGHDVFCSIDKESRFKEQGWGAERIYEHCLDELIDADAILCFVRTSDKSSGIEREVRKSIQLGKPITLAVNCDVPDVFLQEAYRITRASCAKVIEYTDLKSLCTALREL